MRPGDWMCSLCNNHNFASKVACNRCQSPKALASKPLQGMKDLRPGDWLCTSCENLNFANRYAAPPVGISAH
jgi:hypothetical protein